MQNHERHGSNCPITKMTKALEERAPDLVDLFKRAIEHANDAGTELLIGSDAVGTRFGMSTYGENNALMAHVDFKLEDDRILRVACDPTNPVAAEGMGNMSIAIHRTLMVLASARAEATADLVSHDDFEQMQRYYTKHAALIQQRLNGSVRTNADIRPEDDELLEMIKRGLINALGATAEGTTIGILEVDPNRPGESIAEQIGQQLLDRKGNAPTSSNKH